MQQWVPRGRVLDERLVREHPFGGLQTLSSQPGVEEGSGKRPEEESRETEEGRAAGRSGSVTAQTLPLVLELGADDGCWAFSAVPLADRDPNTARQWRIRLQVQRLAALPQGRHSAGVWGSGSASSSGCKWPPSSVKTLPFQALKHHRQQG